MNFPTKWGNFRLFPPKGESGMILAGRANLGGQDYRILLRLYSTGNGWIRKEYEDLRIVKINGPLAGKPARLAAREVVVDYLPELVNSVYPVSCG